MPVQSLALVWVWSTVLAFKHKKTPQKNKKVFGGINCITFCQSFGSTSSARWSQASSCEVWRHLGKLSCNPQPPWAPGCWWRTWRERWPLGGVIACPFSLLPLPFILWKNLLSCHFSPQSKGGNDYMKGSRAGAVTGGLARRHSQEKVLHHVVVIVTVAVWQEAGCKHDDGVVLRVVAWERRHSHSQRWRRPANTCHWTLWKLLVRI